MIVKEALINSSAKIAQSDFEANWTKKPQGAVCRSASADKQYAHKV